MELTDLQVSRLNDVQISIRSCMDNIQRTAEYADFNDITHIKITTTEAFLVLDVMAFARALGDAPIKKDKQ